MLTINGMPNDLQYTYKANFCILLYEYLLHTTAYRMENNGIKRSL